ncbi:MAG: PHP domain-containing protein [Synechococcales cyanobacterium T60_A2020_003]|nr:PHP domain-containing protein [Synechococcales cyanobacterium T60_A2020_003]
MLELHCHTTCSDGVLTPTQLVQAAHQAGVRAIAITDHDTISGWEEASAASQALPIEIVPGIELSTIWNGRSLHLLGFYPDPVRLQEPLKERVAERWRRAQRMADKLGDLGYPITLPEPTSAMVPGRPHIANLLREAGYVKTVQDAFDRWLKEGKAAYVPYEKFTAIEGIELLRSCGAVPVWAHPYLFQAGTVEALLPTFVEAGLMGLEVYHPTHTPRQQLQLVEWCDRYNLLKTGGSDYHGSTNPNEPAYPDLNHFQVPYDLLLPIQKAAQSRL